MDMDAACGTVLIPEQLLTTPELQDASHERKLWQAMSSRDHDRTGRPNKYNAPFHPHLLYHHHSPTVSVNSQAVDVQSLSICFDMYVDKQRTPHAAPVDFTSTPWAVLRQAHVPSSSTVALAGTKEEQEAVQVLIQQLPPAGYEGAVKPNFVATGAQAAGSKASGE